MANQSYSPQARARRHGGKLLAYPSLEKATNKDFASLKVAIFIHGFTADCTYMRELMHQFDGADFSCIAFEYPSDRGIDHAARQLRDLLEGYDTEGLLSQSKAVLVGHSMGGLVARAFVTFEGGDKFVRTIVTLGSPHQGTLKSSKFLEYLLAWGEDVSGISPLVFPVDCESAKQLLGLDGVAGRQPLVARLNATQSPPGVAYHSISGAMPQLEFGRNPIRNMLANKYLGRHLKKPHDGFVEEASSNLAGDDLAAAAPGCQHHTNYADYASTNHSYLVNNQTVAMLALRCAVLPTTSRADEHEAQAALEKARTSSQGFKPPV